MKHLQLIARKDAKANGLKRYFTGKPCIRNHVDERMTSTGQCYSCLSSDEYVIVKKNCDKRLYQENKEERKKQSKEYALKTKVLSEKTRKKWYEKNKAKKLAYHKEWSAKNKNYLKFYQKQWRAENRDICNFHEAKYRSDKLQRTPIWADLSAMQLEYELAAWCSKVMGVKYHVDHIIPLRGKFVSGLHVPSNLQVIPATDNLVKSNKFKE